MAGNFSKTHSGAALKYKEKKGATMVHGSKGGDPDTTAAALFGGCCLTIETRAF